MKPQGIEALRAALVGDTDVPSHEAQRPGDVDGGDPMTAKTRGRLFALFGLPDESAGPERINRA